MSTDDQPNSIPLRTEGSLIPILAAWEVRIRSSYASSFLRDRRFETLKRCLVTNVLDAERRQCHRNVSYDEPALDPVRKDQEMHQNVCEPNCGDDRQTRRPKPSDERKEEKRYEPALHD